MVKRHENPIQWNDLETYDSIQPAPPRHFRRNAAWAILLILIAGWVGWEVAPMVGAAAVTLQEGLK